MQPHKVMWVCIMRTALEWRKTMKKASPGIRKPPNKGTPMHKPSCNSSKQPFLFSKDYNAFGEKILGTRGSSL